MMIERFYLATTKGDQGSRECPLQTAEGGGVKEIRDREDTVAMRGFGGETKGERQGSRETGT